GVFAYGGDVTALANARQEAAATDERLRIALNAGRGVVWEVDLKAFTMTWFGDPKPIYGEDMTFADFPDVLMCLYVVEHRDFINRSFDQAIQGEIESFEHRLPGPDGEVRWVQVYVTGVKGESGKVRRVVGLTKDVTARKREEERFLASMMRAEEALRAKRNML